MKRINIPFIWMGLLGFVSYLIKDPTLFILSILWSMGWLWCYWFTENPEND